MEDIKSISLALDPTNTPSFLLDWELTKLCNLDCSYCGVGIDYGGHNNDTLHPPKQECIDAIDFMFEYVDLYMQHKKPTQRKVVLNVYGGESLFHPDIVEILQAVRTKYEPYKNNWYLTVACTTNAIVGPTRWEEILPLIDNFTTSYHSENLPKQKELFKANVLRLKELKKPFRAVVMMHNNPVYWDDGVSMIEFLKSHEIDCTPKPLDNVEPEWVYSAEQFTQLKTMWINKVPTKSKEEYKKKIIPIGIDTDTHSSIASGRPCCGGRKLSVNDDLKNSMVYVPKQGFKGWSCSVNWFFLYLQQLTGNIYTNKDCRMSTSGNYEPLGNINDTNTIIDTLRTQLETDSMPIIVCKKEVCMCGICAPKAESKEEFRKLINRHTTTDVFRKD